MTTLSREAITALEDVKLTVRRTPEAISMSSWFSGELTQIPRKATKIPNSIYALIPEGFCKTKGCIAGNLALNAGYLPVMLARDKKLSTIYLAHPVTKALEAVSDIGTAILGLDADITTELFLQFNEADYDDCHLDHVWYGLDATKPEDICIAIDRFIAKYR